MIFELVADYADVLDAMPQEHPRHRILKLLDEAIRRDVHLIDRHPTTLFQCLWNTCWWYDTPQAAKHLEIPEARRQQSPSWEQDELKLFILLEKWNKRKQQMFSGHRWVRSLRPPKLQLGSGQLSEFRNQKGAVTALAFSPVSGRIASSHRYGSDAATCIWDLETGLDLHRLNHQSAVAYLTFSRSGENLITITQDGTVTAWHTDSGQPLGHAERSVDDDSLIDVSPNADAVLLRQGGGIFVWGLVDDAEPVRLEFDSSPADLRHLKFCLDGEAVFGIDHTVCAVVWDTETGARKVTFPCNESCRTQISEVATCSAGLVAIGYSDGRICLVELVTGRQTHCLEGHNSGVTHLCLSPDGRRLASASCDGVVCSWIAPFERATSRLEQPDDRAVFDIHLSSHSDRLVIVTGYQSVAADRPTPTPKGTADMGVGRFILGLGCAPQRIKAVHFRPLVVHTCSTRQLNECRSFSLAVPLPVIVCAVGDADEVVATGDIHGGVHLWNTMYDGIRPSHNSENAFTYDIRFSLDGKLLATWARVVQVWNALDGTLIQHLDIGDRSPVHCKFSPNGSHIVVVHMSAGVEGRRHNRTSVWQVESGTQIAEYDGDIEIEFAANGSRFRCQYGVFSGQTGEAITFGDDEWVSVLEEPTSASIYCYQLPDGRGLIAARREHGINSPRHWYFKNGIVHDAFWVDVRELDLELVVKTCGTNEVVGWVPATPDAGIETALAGRCFAQESFGHLYLFRLEGDTESCGAISLKQFRSIVHLRDFRSTRPEQRLPSTKPSQQSKVTESPKSGPPERNPLQRPRSPESPQTNVLFERSSKQFYWVNADGSLLDLALKHEITIDYGCRMGNCGSCLVALKKGRVRYLYQPCFELPPDCCLTCIGVPDGDVILDV